MLDSEPERFVVITHKGSDCLSAIWDSGVRHVLFEGDPPNTAQLAVIAAELRLPAPKSSKSTAAPEKQSAMPPFASAPLNAVHAVYPEVAAGRMDPF